MNDEIKNLIDQTLVLGGDIEEYIESELKNESNPRLYDSLIEAQLKLQDAWWKVIKLLENL